MLRQITGAGIATLLIFVVQVGAQPTLPDAGPDPRSRTKAYEPPAQVVLRVENIETRPLDPKYQKRADDLQAELDKATDPKDRERLTKAVASAQREADRRTIKRFSGYMAVLGPRDGRFDDATPHARYYLVGTLEVEPKDQDLVRDVAVNDFMLVPDAIGGEGANGLSVFCTPSDRRNSKPRVIAGAPRWWMERDIRFVPPWEGDNGPVAIPNALSAQLLPITGKVQGDPYGMDSKIIRVIRIQNVSKQHIAKARYIVRVTDKSGVELCVVSQTAQPSTHEPPQKPPTASTAQQHPELGKMAMAIDTTRSGLVIENLASGASIEAQIAVPANSNERAAMVQALMTYRAD